MCNISTIIWVRLETAQDLQSDTDMLMTSVHYSYQIRA